MAISVNRVNLVGRAGSNPEAKGRDGSVVTFSLATSRSWKDRQTGERREDTQWHKIVVFDEHSGRFCKEYVKKGDLVYIQGTIETRKWEKEPGNDVYITEIVVRPFDGSVQSEAQKSGSEQRSSGSNERSGGNERSGSNDRSGAGSFGGQAYGGGFGGNMEDDDIPF